VTRTIQHLDDNSIVGASDSTVQHGILHEENRRATMDSPNFDRSAGNALNSLNSLNSLNYFAFSGIA
jgi:hypothetical protein